MAAYINYPYFQFSHPKRYQFLKGKVFGGKHYYPEEEIGYLEKVTLDFQKAIESKNWEKVIAVSREVARDYHPEIEKKLILQMENEIKNAPDSVRDLKFALRD